MIGVEDLARLIEVQPILGPLRPGQLDQPLEVGALDRVFGRRLRHLLEALELLARRLLDVGRHLGRLDLLVERVEVAGVFAFAELVLDRLQLLAEHRLALVLRELLAHLQVDLLLDLDQLHLALQQHQQPPQPLRDVALDEQRGALVRRQVDGRGDDVAEPARVLVLVEHLRRLVRDVRRDGDELLGDVVDRHAEAVDLDRVLADLDQRLVAGDEVGLLLREADDAAALHAAQHRGHAVLGRLHDADDLALDADRVEVRAGRLFDVGVLLGADQHARALAAERLDEAQRAGAADLDRHDRAGEQHQVAQRQAAGASSGFQCSFVPLFMMPSRRERYIKIVAPGVLGPPVRCCADLLRTTYASRCRPA